MTKSQKRALNRLLAILILLILLLTVTLLAKRRQETAEDDSSASSGDASTSQVTEETIGFTSLSYNNGSATLSFSLKEDGVWYWDGDRDFPLDTTAIDAIMAALSPLEPEMTITEGDTLEAYGLDDDTLHLTAVYEDGTQIQLTFGDQVPEGTNYYALKDGDTETVYVLSSTIPSKMATAIYDMMALPQLPQLEEKDYSSVTVQGSQETVVVAFEGTGQSDGSAASSASSAEEAAVSWLCDGVDVTDNERLRELISALSALELDACQDFKPTADAVTLWGLDTPAVVVKITYGTNQLLTLQIGAETLDGDGYYVRIDDDATIYSISADGLEPILTVAELGLTGAEDAGTDDAAAGAESEP